MSSTLEKKIMNLEERLRAENESRDRDRHGGEVGGPGMGLHSTPSGPMSSPALRRPQKREYGALEVLVDTSKYRRWILFQ